MSLKITQQTFESILDRIAQGLLPDSLEARVYSAGAGDDKALHDVYSEIYKMALQRAEDSNLFEIELIRDLRTQVIYHENMYQRGSDGIDGYVEAVNIFEAEVQRWMVQASSYTQTRERDHSINIREITELAKLPATERTSKEQSEFDRVRRRWLETGGELKVKPDEVIDALMRGAEIVTGGEVVESSMWGG